MRGTRCAFVDNARTMNTTRILTSLALALLLASCSGDDTVQPPITGEIAGRVELTYINGTNGDDAGVIVSLDAQPSIRDTTDASGAYRLAGVPPGTHSVTFERNGFGDYRAFGIEIEGGSRESLPLVEMGEIPRATVTSLAAGTGSDAIVFSGTVSELGLFDRSQNVAVHIGLSDTVSSLPSAHSLVVVIEVPRGATTFSSGSSIQYLRASGLPSGRPLYAVAYIVDYFTSTHYTPPGQSRQYWTSQSGPSQRVSFTIP